MKTERKPLGLYLHIPFCARKCDYCDFYSFAPEENGFVERYVSAMMLQMEDMSKECRGYSVDTVYFGGGTPTLLPIKQFTRLIESAKRNFYIEKDAEITVEANPGTVNLQSLKALRKLGVNRLSLGMQSHIDSELVSLGRIHTSAEFDKSYENARRAGFENISVDIMYGIPGQTLETLGKTLEYVCDMAPEHISLYCLKLEEGTPLFERQSSLSLPDDDTEYEMYEESVRSLSASGYRRYEMSNFALGKNASRHNLKYWNCDEYLGIGASAHSYLAGTRFSIIRDASCYIDAMEIPEAGIEIYDENRAIGEEERMNEYVMLRMRLEDGVNIGEFKRRFGVNFSDKFGKYFDEYVPDGFVTKSGGKYAFTTKGMFVSNYILSAVLDFPEEKTTVL